MVGDVKQSIYRFRLAEPGLFLEKYKAYRSNKEESPEKSTEGGRIDLARNFRSRHSGRRCGQFYFQTNDE